MAEVVSVEFRCGVQRAEHLNKEMVTWIPGSQVPIAEVHATDREDIVEMVGRSACRRKTLRVEVQKAGALEPCSCSRGRP